MNTPHSDVPATIRLGHSPDPDDAYMWWPLFERDGQPAAVSSPRFRFEQVVEDIEQLNLRACEASDEDALEITGISCACYPHVADRYAITACGASLGDGYGPRLVTRHPITLNQLAASKPSIAVPGERTTAYLVSRLMFKGAEVDWKPMRFDAIPEAVASGAVDAGVVIHEGQLTYAEDGLTEIQDLGVWWQAHHELPLPLGAKDDVDGGRCIGSQGPDAGRDPAPQLRPVAIPNATGLAGGKPADKGIGRGRGPRSDRRRR